jgi:hypothetical protein
MWCVTHSVFHHIPKVDIIENCGAIVRRRALVAPAPRDLALAGRCPSLAWDCRRRWKPREFAAGAQCGRRRSAPRRGSGVRLAGGC